MTPSNIASAIGICTKLRKAEDAINALLPADAEPISLLSSQDVDNIIAWALGNASECNVPVEAVDNAQTSPMPELGVSDLCLDYTRATQRS